MEPYERMRYTFFRLFRTILIIIGHDYLRKEGLKRNWYTYSMYLVNVAGFTSCIYTVMCYDVPTGLNSIGYGAVNIQVQCQNHS